MSESRASSWSTYVRMLREARRYWPHIGAVFVLNLLSTPLKLLLPLPLAIAVDNVLKGEPLGWAVKPFLAPFAAHGSSALLAAICGMLVLLTFVAYLNGLAIWILHTFTSERLLLEFRSKLLRHLQELPLTYHDKRGTTDSTYRLQYDAQAVQWIVMDGIQPFVTSSVTIVAMLWVIALLDWQLAAIGATLIPLLIVLTRFWGNRLRRQWLAAKELQSSALSLAQESLGSMRVVKAFGSEDRERTRFTAQAALGMREQIRVATSQGTFDLASGTLLGAGTAAVLYFGVRHIQAGALSLGDFLLVWTYLAQLFGPLELIGKKLSTLQGALASGERALAILDEVPHVIERPNARPLTRAAGRISFERVSFSYPDSPLVLNDITFDIEPGSCVGFIGTTGAGKTTIAALLMRFYDPTGGRIMLDGIDLRDYQIADLRSQFSVVLQEPVLFSTSIAENIAYGKPSATSEEIEVAAEAANADDFIKSSELGFGSMVGERGMMLSGGERQRIVLARAFLRDAPLLILDEPTSAVDVHTEALIGEALKRLTKGRTTLLITHRTSLLRFCDRVLSVGDGGVVEQRQTPPGGGFSGEVVAGEPIAVPTEPM
jgi:ATP-binding cassette subfamily B protein